MAISDAELVTQIDETLENVISSRDLPGRLSESVRYAVLGPGKRIRPQLVMRSFLAVSGKKVLWPVALQAAAAVELVHAFSLVHDDLPAMDDDDVRRGRPTLHVAFDEATAILAGDLMLSLAWEVMAMLGRPAEELAKSTTDMITGQVLDTFGFSSEELDDRSKLKVIHTFKTGALIRSACCVGGRVGLAPEERVQGLTRYADSLGLMFQAVDDLLDVTSDAEKLGKATQKDADAGKLTYPRVYGVDGTRREIVRLHHAARAALEGFPPSADPLRELADRLATRDR